ncbi:MAG: polysaccharide biosynthesis C-terminal domain-containing protein [Pseudomonadota bacterium]
MLDLLGDRHAVLGHVRRAEALLQDDVPAGGAEGDALGVLVTAGVFLPVYFAVAMRFLHLRILDIGTILFRPLAASALMYVTVRRVLHVTGNDALDLVIAVAVGAVVFIVVLFALWALMPRNETSGESFVLERVKERLPGRA